MSQKIINLGSEPGNLGDGDTLRDAFKKTQDNFTELYYSEIVTDTSISDHADPSITGSVAQALEKATLNGGGTVILGPGIFNCNSSLYIKENVRLVGAGRYATQINALHFSDVIVFGTGTTFLYTKGGLEHLTVSMPVNSAANGIKGVIEQARRCYIFSIEVTGGNSQSWGLTLDSVNEFLVNSFTYSGDGNGIRCIKKQNVAANYGDSTIMSTDIILKNPGTIGILFQGNANKVINNILLDRVSVSSNGINPGTIGIKITLASRLGLVGVDIENMETAIVNGPNSSSCSFISTYMIGCTTDYTEVAPVGGTTILGGDGDFASDHRLPTRNLRLYDASVGEYTFVGTGIRDIKPHTDPATPRILTAADSGAFIHTNMDATGPVTFVLPNALNLRSLKFTFSVVENYELRIMPDNGADHIRGYDGTLNTTQGSTYIFSSIVGTTGTLQNVSNTWWIMDNRLGVWEAF